MTISEKILKKIYNGYEILENKFGEKMAKSIAVGITIVFSVAIITLGWIVRREVNYYFAYGSQVEQSIDERLAPLEKRILLLEKKVKALSNK